jgi:glycosyltransferase involved in cell wall biosynthesis
MAKILFVHNFFPGQFGFIASELVRLGNDVFALGGKTSGDIPGVSLVRWHHKRGTTPNILPTAIRAEADMIRAAAAFEAARGLAGQGYSPDVIIGHPGWGETLYLKELWPEARLILHAEFYYGSAGSELGFDPEFGEATLAERCRAVSKSATLALAYSQADQLVSPTPFQASRLPEIFRSRLAIIHEGVDLQQARPAPEAVVTIGTKTFSRKRPLVTFASRVLEPLRGCHTFFRSLPKILEQIPDVEIVIAGEETGAGYGASPPDNETWKSHFWKEIEGTVDASRIHFVGWLPNETLNGLMSISAAHVYLTYPFVLSWSLLEAMACEALVIASDTPPVRDVIVDGENGILVDFLSPGQLSEAVIAAIRNPEHFAGIRRAARQTILDDYDRNEICLPQWLDIIRSVST